MSFISMLGVALTLDHSTLDWNPKRLIHWITTGLFIAFTLLPIFLFFMLNRKKYKNFTVMGLMVLLVLAAFAIIFIGVGKCALMEMIPIAMMLILMLVANFTPILKNGDVKKAQTV